jgi:hypothetical protein
LSFIPPSQHPDYGGFTAWSHDLLHHVEELIVEVLNEVIPIDKHGEFERETIASGFHRVTESRRMAVPPNLLDIRDIC